MDSKDSPAEIVARFLRANNFSDTLAAFLKEAGLPANAGSFDAGSLTIEQILREKKLYDLTANFEKTALNGSNQGWTLLAPAVSSILSLPSAANILQASIEMFEVAGRHRPLLMVTAADRRLMLLDPGDSFNVVRSITQFQDSPILTYVILSLRYIFCGSMSGSVFIYDIKLDRIIAKRKDHSKFVVRLAAFDAGNGHTWIASAGWDRKIFIYDIVVGDGATPIVQEPMGHIDLLTNPEAILLRQDPDTGQVHLVGTRRDSTFISFYNLSHLSARHGDDTTTISPAGQQNIAPYSNAWIAFSPATMALSPTDRSRVAIATSSVPHMKVLIVRLLFPKEESHPNATVDLQSRVVQHQGPIADAVDTRPSAEGPPSASQLQGREEAAVYLHCNAFAPQTPYSTPAIAWRPDGSGLWVNSDDGIIRGLDASTGKVTATLEGHEPGSKIRCLWAGWANMASHGDPADECLVSGGFDQRLIVWRSPSSSTISK